MFPCQWLALTQSMICSLRTLILRSRLRANEQLLVTEMLTILYFFVFNTLNVAAHNLIQYLFFVSRIAHRLDDTTKFRQATGRYKETMNEKHKKILIFSLLYLCEDTSPLLLLSSSNWCCCKMNKMPAILSLKTDKRKLFIIIAENYFQTTTILMVDGK